MPFTEIPRNWEVLTFKLMYIPYDDMLNLKVYASLHVWYRISLSDH